MTEEKEPNKPPNHDYQHERRFARECVLQILYQNETGNNWEWSPQRATHFWEQILGLEEADMEKVRPHIITFVESVVTGILQEQEKLDDTIKQAASNWSLTRMSAIDRNILRLAIYEICYRDEIPPIASINEAVELAKKFGDKDSPRFINGVLDRALRERNKSS